MLTLTEAQWLRLQKEESQRFVVSVCDEFLDNRGDMREYPGRATVLKRMQDAFEYAGDAGFCSTPHIMRLMHLAADAPHIHDDPVVDRYLRKPGDTPEQRLDDLDAVMKKKLEGDG